MIQPTAAQYEIRCHSCSHGLGHTRAGVRIVGLFKASMFGRLPSRRGEIRKRCGSCGWVNVFYLGRPDAGDEFEVKSAA
jgi:hypothetical protein